MQELIYLKPNTIDEALNLLDMYKNDLKILAGGTDLIVALREKNVCCKYMMDIKGIKEFQNIEINEGLSIGAAVSLNEIISSEDVKNNYPILVQAARTLANSLLRNRATLVGNICNASPGGDMLSPSIVLDAQVEIISKQGKRIVKLQEFFLGVKKTVLKENELVSKIIFPQIEGTGRYLRKSRIKGHDLAQVGVAVFLKNDGRLNMAIGAVGPTPVVINEIDGLNVRDNKEEIVKKVLSQIKPITDQRATKEFRIAMVDYLVRQILDELGREV